MCERFKFTVTIDMVIFSIPMAVDTFLHLPSPHVKTVECMPFLTPCSTSAGLVFTTHIQYDNNGGDVVALLCCNSLTILEEEKALGTPFDALMETNECLDHFCPPPVQS